MFHNTIAVIIIHNRSPFPHYDLIGSKQKEILRKERLWKHMEEVQAGDGIYPVKERGADQRHPSQNK
ncbi:hypothetical protein ACFO8Q_10735 [Effusibacillus consociatus]|uniref:Uncharacterized protein n=1 Tax=Effusibacillus consociatus TaxID=1117041 RepID=A0ABV9Q173_9BACL